MKNRFNISVVWFCVAFTCVPPYSLNLLKFFRKRAEKYKVCVT